MYFASRAQAGRLLASKLSEKYRYENCAVVALNDGGVVVGAQIATELHCVLSLMMSAEIRLPREPEPIAAITPTGVMVYNNAMSTGEISEFGEEYRNLIEQEKLEQMHHMNEMLGDGGVISKDLLYGRNIILVSDGMKSGFEIDLAYEFLKPVKMEKLVIATPLASVKAVDRMHVLGDDLCCLDVSDDFLDIDHYYEKNDVPSHEAVVKTIQEIILNWK